MPIFGISATRSYDNVVKFKIYNRWSVLGRRHVTYYYDLNTIVKQRLCKHAHVIVSDCNLGL